MIVHRTTKTGRRARKHPCTIHHWYRLSHGDERRKISHTHRERERERKREFMNRKHTRVRLCHFTHSFILFLFYSISDKINHASALTLTYRLRKIRASKLSNAIDRDVCTYTMSLSLLSLSLSKSHTTTKWQQQNHHHLSLHEHDDPIHQLSIGSLNLLYYVFHDQHTPGDPPQHPPPSSMTTIPTTMTVLMTPFL